MSQTKEGMMTISDDKLTETIKSILRPKDNHWVGDGFPVRTLFFYEEQGQELSPFLLLDYAGPQEFPPTEARPGVGPHPHRGFETVTIVYSGEVEHRDSSGGGGKIGPGDVQWMTAASGLVHEEYHGRDYAIKGGLFEMVQLWVNLPSKDKMVPPRYQGITSDDIPIVTLSDGIGQIRVIAGEYDGNKGSAMTYSPVHVWDIKINTEKPMHLDVPIGQTKLLVVLRGSVTLDNAEIIGEAEVVMFNRDCDLIQIQQANNTTALLLSGEPLGEPIVGYGPFVMNSSLEIHDAIDDYKNGRLGNLT
jgi:redox-sensitive bicupin YhaK (pirin superfamily)